MTKSNCHSVSEVFADTVADPKKFGSPTAQAMRVGNQLFISGTMPWDVNRKVVGVGDVQTQTRQVLQNMAAILRSEGGALRDVVKITFFVVDIRDKQQIWAVRKEMFGDHRPASTLVEVNHLVDSNAKLEVEAIAILRD